MAGIINGQTPDADEVLALNAINQVYTGSGFDSSQSGNGSDEQDHELDAISSAINSNYAVVKITGTSFISHTNSGDGNIQLKAQIKETGQSYADIITFVKVLRVSIDATNNMESAYTYEIVATLTADMKTNGFQIKVFSKSTMVSGNNDVSFTNVQTTQELRA